MEQKWQYRTGCSETLKFFLFVWCVCVCVCVGGGGGGVQSRPPYQIGREKKGGGYARGWCVRRGSLLQNCLPVKFQDVKFKDYVYA